MDLARRFAETYNRREIDIGFAEFVTADFEWWPALTSAYGGDCYRGREGVERFFADTDENWEQLQSVAEEFRDLGDSVLVLGRLTGRGKGSGAPVDQPYMTILDFRGERIWRLRAYFDLAEGLQAAGLPG